MNMPRTRPTPHRTTLVSGIFLLLATILMVIFLWPGVGLPAWSLLALLLAALAVSAAIGAVFPGGDPGGEIDLSTGNPDDPDVPPRVP
jgi:hypothetical protein